MRVTQRQERRQKWWKSRGIIDSESGGEQKSKSKKAGKKLNGCENNARLSLGDLQLALALFKPCHHEKVFYLEVVPQFPNLFLLKVSSEELTSLKTWSELLWFTLQCLSLKTGRASRSPLSLIALHFDKVPWTWGGTFILLVSSLRGHHAENQWMNEWMNNIGSLSGDPDHKDGWEKLSSVTRIIKVSSRNLPGGDHRRNLWDVLSSHRFECTDANMNIKLHEGGRVQLRPNLNSLFLSAF